MIVLGALAAILTMHQPPTPPEHHLVATPRNEVVTLTRGTASYYYGSRGFHGRPHIAVQDGKWTGKIQRYLNVCIRGHGCHRLPVVDYCQCHRGEPGEKIVDLSIEAVRLFGLKTTAGIWPATISEVR